MKKKTILVSFILVAIGFLMMMPCDKQLLCSGPFADYMGYPLLWFFILVPLTILALTLSDQKHRFWLKFTGIFFAVSMFFVFLMPETARGLMLNPDRESTNWFFLGLYSIISVIYFIVQYFKKSK